MGKRNLGKPPFNLLPAIRYINEGCTEEGDIYKDKYLGLWLIDDLKIKGDV